ncbi:MAG TPA: hypothetical protein VNF50_04165 [Acidimicrobiales bacterium]|nr:hypothetical protein [Acidimicrobiales bacterium]
MLYVFGFDRVGVAVSELYFVDPRPSPGQEGPEHGVRLEVRLIQAGEAEGSIYAARPIEVGRPVWRADLLESVEGPPASFDRTHHHPRFRGWEPGRRQFEEQMSADPIGWVGNRLSDLPGLLEDAGLDASEVSDADADQLRAAVPDILTAVKRLLDGVHAGELATTPAGGIPDRARDSWL